MKQATEDVRPGRSCPLHYRYPAATFARAPDLRADTLYVVGGLYGNVPALETVLDMVAGEQGETALVFNGDFNWFDVAAQDFERINTTVLSHTALSGNVEAELAADDDSAGCGCGYPETVSDAEVERSNRIMAQLRATAARFPALRARLARLPMHAVAQVGDLRIGIVHGDAQSLAGWQFDVGALEDVRQRPQLHAMLAAAGVDGFASSHTCLPALREFALAGRRHWVINNGAAGMPNFANTQFGVLSRFSLRPAPAQASLYGIRAADVFIDALPVRYDHARWLERFSASWQPGTPAHESYWQRICSGPAFDLNRARPLR
ncbi:MAG TPA: hypothetical protein VF523_00125 [Burkholderiales bacterium]